MWPWGCFETLSGLTNFREKARAQTLSPPVKQSQCSRTRVRRFLAQDFGKQENALRLKWRDGPYVRCRPHGDTHGSLPQGCLWSQGCSFRMCPQSWRLSLTPKETLWWQQTLMMFIQHFASAGYNKQSGTINKVDMNVPVTKMMFSVKKRGSYQFSWLSWFSLHWCSPPHVPFTLWRPKATNPEKGPQLAESKKEISLVYFIHVCRQYLL